MNAKRLGLVALLAAAWAGAAIAQAPHPIPPLARALHERAASAEGIAIARVTYVERGRLGVVREAGLRGALPASFEVKRSPLHPPALAVGDLPCSSCAVRARPSCSPGEPTEIVPLASGAEARALADALPALLAAGADPGALRAVYASWAASPSPLLRALGHAGLEALPPPERA